MPLWTSRRWLPALLLALLLTACRSTEPAPELAIDYARLAGSGTAPELRLGLDFRPGATQLAALDHGVPLDLEVAVRGARGETTVSLGLRYFPLSRRYRLHSDAGIDRSFALRPYLLDALGSLRLPLAHNPCQAGTACRVEVTLDRSHLPGALRLTAFLQPGWHLPPALADIKAGS